MKRAPLSERMAGRWKGILPMLGFSPNDLTGKHGPCPMCRGKDRFRFDDKDGKGSWICAQCGAGDGTKLVMLKTGLDFRGAAREIEKYIGDVAPAKPKPDQTDEQKRAAMNELWRASKPIAMGDVADRYLAARGLGQGAYPASLRTIGRLRHKDEDDVVSYHPAIIAMVSGSDGKPVTLHRTYLSGDGAKAAVTPPRKLMACSLPKGVSVRLSAPATVLGVAEGIETSLAASKLFGVPCWAAINTTMMEGWVAPDGTKEVIVFGDNDQKFGGHAAAYTLAHRLAVKGLRVRVEIPDEAGSDWNDSVMADKAMEAA